MELFMIIMPLEGKPTYQLLATILIRGVKLTIHIHRFETFKSPLPIFTPNI